ncbi:MAG: hypothetical protein KIT73_19240 [Burkholderiales bacterium]|nr:hypothetical protein [Burkholderiales bacterium]
MATLSGWRQLVVEGGEAADALANDLSMPMGVAAGTSNNAAVFSRFDRSTGQMIFYFTPAAAHVGIRFGAAECNQPTRRDAGMLRFGQDLDLIERLFGNSPEEE